MAARVTLARRLGGERGSELIEMAIVTPLLLVLVAGVVDYGVLFQRFEIVTNAVREGARLATIPGHTQAQVQNRVVAYLNSAGITSGYSTPVMQPAPIPGPGTNWAGVRVSLTYTHTFIFLDPMLKIIGGGVLPSSFTASAVMRSQVAVAP
jgi:Flp pilus assembly protein TadG